MLLFESPSPDEPRANYRLALLSACLSSLNFDQGWLPSILLTGAPSVHPSICPSGRTCICLHRVGWCMPHGFGCLQHALEIDSYDAAAQPSFILASFQPWSVVLAVQDAHFLLLLLQLICENAFSASAFCFFCFFLFIVLAWAGILRLLVTLLHLIVESCRRRFPNHHAHRLLSTISC